MAASLNPHILPSLSTRVFLYLAQLALQGVLSQYDAWLWENRISKLMMWVCEGVLGRTPTSWLLSSTRLDALWE
jgi:hypothetical protein